MFETKRKRKKRNGELERGMLEQSQSRRRKVKAGASIAMLAMMLIALIYIGAIVNGFVSNRGLGIQLGRRKVNEISLIETQISLDVEDFEEAQTKRNILGVEEIGKAEMERISLDAKAFNEASVRIEIMTEQMAGDADAVNDNTSANETNKHGKLTARESVADSVSNIAVATVTRSVENIDGKDHGRSCDENSFDGEGHFGNRMSCDDNGFDVEGYFGEANRNGSDAGVSGRASTKKTLDTGLSRGYRQIMVNESWRQAYWQISLSSDRLRNSTEHTLGLSLDLPKISAEYCNGISLDEDTGGVIKVDSWNVRSRSDIADQHDNLEVKEIDAVDVESSLHVGKIVKANESSWNVENIFDVANESSWNVENFGGANESSWRVFSILSGT